MAGKSKKKLIIFIIIIFLIIGVSISYFLNNKFSAVKNDPFSTSKLNILVVGYDSSINGPPRADTIMVASIDINSKKTGILFIPRDTRVNIPGHGLGKINASHAYGGIELTDKTLENFLEIPIDYYVETDFEGFASIIDAIGGVTVNIEESLHYEDEAGDLYIDLPEGKVHLNGEEALEYVRYRGPVTGDIGRVQRQQKFIKAVVDKTLNPEIIVKLPKIYREMISAVNTNIPFTDISPFIKLAKNMNFSNFKTEMVPGKPDYINGVSYWLPEKDKLNLIVENLIRSKEYIQNSKYKVSIFNGNGKPGLAGDIADILSKYGFEISSIANADNFDYKETIVKYSSNEEKKVAQGIIELLDGNLKYLEEQKEGIQIIIGKDFIENKEE